MEGITGFELGNALDTVPVVMDKRRNGLFGREEAASSLFVLTVDSNNWLFYMSVSNAAPPKKRLSVAQISL